MTHHIVVALNMTMNVCVEVHVIHCLFDVVHDVYLLQKVNIFLLETFFSNFCFVIKLLSDIAYIVIELIMG